MRYCEDTVQFRSQKKVFSGRSDRERKPFSIFRSKLVFRTFHQNTYIWRQLGHYVRWTLHHYGMKVKIIVSLAISRYYSLFWTLEFEIKGGEEQKIFLWLFWSRQMYFPTDQIASVSDFQLVNLKCKEEIVLLRREILFIFLVNLGDPYIIYIVKMSFSRMPV
jgi:hypothetical protein